MIVVSNGCAARTPASRRIVVPEFLASSRCVTGCRPFGPAPSIVTTPPDFSSDSACDSMTAPRVWRQPSVDAQSAPGA